MPVWNEDDVIHLLNRAGFGASPKDVVKYLRYGQAESVARLVGVPGSGARGPGKADDDVDGLAALRTWWIKRMVKASTRRLQEKMCLFWHDHFATAVGTTKNNLRMALQNRTFRFFGLGAFGQLVLEVTRDAAMLDFLDGNLNKAGKPNENYGRELMELFVLGVVDLSGVENYTQTDVTNMARALTGFQIDPDTNLGYFDPSRWDGGSKTLFSGKSFQATGALGVLDAAQQPLPAGRNVLEILLTHRDSDGELTMPRFLARKLWEYFAYSGPSKALLSELTPGFIAGGFVVADLLSAIFLHEEFYSDRAKTGTVKNPCEYAFHAIRGLDVKTNANALPDLLGNMGMDLFDPPSVNGWDNGLPWVSSGQFLARFNFAQALASGRDATLRLKPSGLATPGESADVVVDRVLGRLGIAARVPAGARQALIDYLGPAPDFGDFTTIETKVRGLVMLALAMPEMHVH